MREVNLLLDGLAANFFIVKGIEGQVLTQEQIQDYAQGPAIHFLVVRVVQQDFWSHIANRAVRFSAFFAWTESLTQTEVNQFYFSVIRGIHKQNVLRLEISMSDSELMQVIECSRQLVNDASSTRLRYLEIS